MDNFDLTDESDFIKEIENINFDDIDDEPPDKPPVEAVDNKSSPLKKAINNNVTNFGDDNKKSANSNPSSDDKGNNKVKKNNGKKTKRSPAKRRPPVKIHFPSTLDLDALLNDQNDNNLGSNNKNNNNNNNSFNSDDSNKIDDNDDLNYNNDDDDVEKYGGRAQSARPDYNGFLSSRKENNECQSARPNYGGSYFQQQREGKLGAATNTSIPLLEARMINYMNNSMKTLKEEFVFDLKNLFENADHTNSIFDSFIMSINSELRREISFKTEPIDHSFVNSVQFPIDLDVKLFFPQKNSKISNFQVREYIEQVSDLASNISKTLKSESLSISEELQNRDSEISKCYFEDKALRQKVKHLRQKEGRLQYQLQETNCEKNSVEKYRKVFSKKIEDYESQKYRNEERADEINDIKKHFDKFKEDLSHNKIVHQKRNIVKKLKQAVTENEELRQYCDSLEIAVSSFKNFTDDIEFAFLEVETYPSSQASVMSTLPAPLTNDLAVYSSESPHSPRYSSVSGCASDSPRFYSDDVKNRQQQQQLQQQQLQLQLQQKTNAISSSPQGIKKKVDKRQILDDDDFETDEGIGGSHTNLSSLSIERRIPLRIGNLV